jgi:hypothetical protein
LEGSREAEYKCVLIWREQQILTVRYLRILTRLWDERLLAARFQKMGVLKVDSRPYVWYECICQATLRELVHDWLVRESLRLGAERLSCLGGWLAMLF